MAVDTKVSAMTAATTPLSGSELLLLALAAVGDRKITFDQFCVEVLQRGLAASSPKLNLKDSGGFNFTISGDGSGRWDVKGFGLAFTDLLSGCVMGMGGGLNFNDGTSDRLTIFQNSTLSMSSPTDMVLSAETDFHINCESGPLDFSLGGNFSIDSNVGVTQNVVAGVVTLHIYKGIIVGVT